MEVSDHFCYCHFLLGLNRNTKESHFAVMIASQDIQIWLQKLNKDTEQTLVPNSAQKFQQYRKTGYKTPLPFTN